MQVPRPVRWMLLLALLLALPACSYSEDKHTFKSTIDIPKTVSVYDSMRNTELWSKAIPVQHKLILHFKREGDISAMKVQLKPAETMSWELYADGVDDPIEKGLEEMPRTPIMIKMVVRPAPEFPPAKALTAKPATAPPPHAASKPATKPTAAPVVTEPATTAPVVTEPPAPPASAPAPAPAPAPETKPAAATSPAAPDAMLQPEEPAPAPTPEPAIESESK
ncbi:MAG: hypothetical protein K8S99_13945 [Planctomycetes bacterium]|nr:hypothetical protein [Planctomycetota bacterium]